MDKIFEQVLLYDFYGELLTAHQKTVYEAAVYNDMSLGEIAQEQGISRQGVHDLIKRCDKLLLGYESKLHLLERFTNAKEKIQKIEELTKYDDECLALRTHFDIEEQRKRMEQIRVLSKELMQEL